MAKSQRSHQSREMKLCSLNSCKTRHLLHLCTHLCCSGTFLGGVYLFQNQGSDIAYPNQKNYNSNSLLNPQVTVVAAVMITAAKDEYEGQTVRRLLVRVRTSRG